MNAALPGPGVLYCIPPLLGVGAVAVLVDRLSCRGPYCPPEARAVRRVARLVLAGAVGMTGLCAWLGWVLARAG